MRKIVLMICGAMTVSSMFAQITLTSETSAPRIGDVFHYYLTDKAEGLNISHGGENQEWDMSAVEEGTLAEVRFISVAQSTNPSSTSNIVGSSPQSGMEEFCTVSPTGFAFNKIAVPGYLSTSYTDARELIKFPIVYNQEYSETFAGTITNLMNGQVFDVNGSTKIKADGYGKLKLPYGAVIDNVLRVKIIYDYTYSYYSMPYFMLSDTTYLWYNANTRNYIADYAVSYSKYPDMPMEWENIQKVFQYLSQDDIVITITGMKPTYDNSLSIYPNPTQGIINVEGTNEISDVKIYNMNGTLLQQKKSSVIDISDYSNGLYIMEIAGKRYKIMKQ